MAHNKEPYRRIVLLPKVFTILELTRVEKSKIDIEKRERKLVKPKLYPFL